MKLIKKVVTMFIGLAWVISACGDELSSTSAWRLVLSPMAGSDRNDLRRPAGPAGTVTVRDRGPMFGLFGMAAHPNWVITDFLFYSDVNDADVWGNLFIANYYADSKAPVTWNVGGGHLYHLIETARGDITVEAPMLKAGPVIRIPSFRLWLNPYVGYMWERVEAPKTSPMDDEAALYGVTAGWRWRMLEAGVNYYYQDVRDSDEGLHVFRARLIAMITRHWGVGGRVDYSEHRTTDDLFVLAGPVFMF